MGRRLPGGCAIIATRTLRAATDQLLYQSCVGQPDLLGEQRFCIPLPRSLVQSYIIANHWHRFTRLAGYSGCHSDVWATLAYFGTLLESIVALTLSSVYSLSSNTRWKSPLKSFRNKCIS